MSIVDKIRQYGVEGSIRKATNIVMSRSGYMRWRFRNAPKYANPTPDELEVIERQLLRLGVPVVDLAPDPSEFEDFKSQCWFPSEYHGGRQGAVWDEKVLEHWIASRLLHLMEYSQDDVYVDVAAGGSPWAQALRERQGASAYAIDLHIAPAFARLPYYRVENATTTKFSDGSVKGASLHCAYEMFQNDDDTHFVTEAARILKPGGKVVILPLYMHTHYCAYATPEYFGKGYAGRGAKEYIRLDCSGVPSSRKYDAERLVRRVLDPIRDAGMHYRLLVLRNKERLGRGIYCHFVLEFGR